MVVRFLYLVCSSDAKVNESDGKKCCKKLLKLFEPILRYNLAFVSVCVSGYCRQKKYEIKE